MCLCHKILSSQVYSEDPDHIAPAAVVRLAYSITRVLGPEKTFFQFSIKLEHSGPNNMLVQLERGHNSLTRLFSKKS